MRTFIAVIMSLPALCQLPALPNVYSDPAANCYALLSRPVDGGVAFTLVRIDTDVRCDITPSVPLQFIAVQFVDQVARNGTVFAVDLANQTATTVALPKGIYETYLSSTLFAFPQPPNQTDAFATIGAYQEYCLTFAGQAPTWQSETWNHVPFASTLYPAQASGNTLSFGIALHGPTTGIVYQTGDDGKLRLYRWQIMSDDPAQAAVSLPAEFTFNRDIYVHLVDNTTSLASDYRIFDALALSPVGKATGEKTTGAK